MKEKNSDLKMERLIIIFTAKNLKIAKDYLDNLYRVVKSEVELHKNDDEYFCYRQIKKGIIFNEIEIVSYDTYLCGNSIDGKWYEKRKSVFTMLRRMKLSWKK
ncbi:hypothetical protein IAI10_16635 [Clostridium sp. 19966]|uniref:hypothetical protein n=1 Tax=Clostridium sp. 19966 TaxID=2768166 RepID=UPI0028DE2DCB|nr:hypothetical protein [Clostridium sp. 19966]MDT8718296.1 hypothetical protein [Clostridium sp. 19966]